MTNKGIKRTTPHHNINRTGRTTMDRAQILAHYDWADGVCFRHPSKGEVLTAVVGIVHPRSDGDREVRACEDCVIAIEDMRRETAASAGSEYEPGHVGEALG